MNSIFKNFKEGSSVEKLAIVSNIFTIAGVSLAALITPLLAIPNISFNAFFGISIISLMTLIVVAFILLLALYADYHLNSETGLKGTSFYLLIRFIIWAFFLIGSIMALAFSYSLITGTMWS